VTSAEGRDLVGTQPVEPTAVAVTVVIPTIGRPDMLARTLASLTACEPGPAEILIVDQSPNGSTLELARQEGPPGTRTLVSRGRGRPLALNEGLRAASNEVVFMTDDDCTVRSDWIAVGTAAIGRDGDRIVSGQVLAGGVDDPRLVPATHIDPVRHSYTGDVIHGGVTGGNVVVPRDAALALGGFDERMVPAAEDWDFGHRWLRAGGHVIHEPDLVVTHRGWRGPGELEQLYADYHRANGIFFGKLLRAHDPAALRFIAQDLHQWMRSLYSAWFRGVPRWADHRRGTSRGLVPGLITGWRRYAPRSD
jgi:GT2 family glycosyltransferase